MICDLSITLLPENEGNEKIIREKIFESLCQKKIPVKNRKIIPVFVKKSVDARRKTVKLVMRYRVYIDEEPRDEEKVAEYWKKAAGNKKVIIVGSGPAGLYAAFRLLEDGIKPIIIERGSPANVRATDIACLKSKGILNENSNFCYGAGGAGTFSDGKLYTRSNKRGDIYKIYRIFVEFGADRKILTDAHPHIGTDRLPGIIDGMEKKILELGGEIHFNTVFKDFILDENRKKVLGVKVSSVKADNNAEKNMEILGDAVILGTGHSASDVYEIIGRTSPDSLEAKTFAVGVRVEHPRAVIDEIQFHGQKMNWAAEYRLAAQVEERGVYSFCMCPGGFVVPCATKKNQIVVNGMSASGRNSPWSNAAIVVEIRPEDIPEEFMKKAEDAGCKALAGLFWRTWLEELAFKNGKGQFAPAQKMIDFINGRESFVLGETSYKPGVVPSRLDLWIPEKIKKCLKEGFLQFDKSMRGFVCEDALMIAMETRTSTPVRIKRSKETFECMGLENLYPCGEGSGYSGGIGSSAMDGEKVAAAIVKKLENNGE